MPRGVKGSGSGYVHSAVWGAFDSLPGDAVKVALGLCKLAGKPGRWTGSFVNITAVTGISRKATISTSLALLEAKGVLTIRRQDGAISEYEIADNTVTPGVTVDNQTVTHGCNGPEPTVTAGVTVAPKVLPDGSPLQPPSLTPLQEIDTSCKKGVTNNNNSNQEEEKFNELWKHYPRKVDRTPCFKVCLTLVKSGKATWEQLTSAAKNYAKARNGQEKQFTKHGSTFFGPKEAWRDFINGNPETPNADVCKDVHGNTVLRDPSWSDEDWQTIKDRGGDIPARLRQGQVANV